MNKLKKILSLAKNKYFLNIIFCKILNKIFFYKSDKLLNKKHNYIKKSLINTCRKTLNKYDDIYSNINNFEDKIEKNIWIMWWQGIENAPEIVKKCINNIFEFNKDCNITIITKENINKYIEIDKNLYNKVLSKSIKFANFSDYIRTSLLSKYGGIWLDSTIFCNKSLDKDIFKYSFYSIKFDRFDNRYVSNLEWTSYFLCSSKNNFLMNFVRDMFIEYFKVNDFSLDYFLIDYFIRIAVDRYPKINEMIKKVPINNTQTEELIKYLNKDFNLEKYRKLCKNTYLFKLNYRIVIDNENSFYYQL